MMCGGAVVSSYSAILQHAYIRRHPPHLIQLSRRWQLFSALRLGVYYKCTLWSTFRATSLASWTMRPATFAWLLAPSLIPAALENSLTTRDIPCEDGEIQLRHEHGNGNDDYFRDLYRGVSISRLNESIGPSYFAHHVVYILSKRNAI